MKLPPVYARFIPQVEIGRGDSVMDCDPLGEDLFDIGPELAISGRDESLNIKNDTYESDCFKDALRAPDWVKEWPGPYRIEMPDKGEINEFFAALERLVLASGPEAEQARTAIKNGPDSTVESPGAQGFQAAAKKADRLGRWADAASQRLQNIAHRADLGFELATRAKSALEGGADPESRPSLQALTAGNFEIMKFIRKRGDVEGAIGTMGIRIGGSEPVELHVHASRHNNLRLVNHVPKTDEPVREFSRSLTLIRFTRDNDKFLSQHPDLFDSVIGPAMESIMRRGIDYIGPVSDSEWAQSMEDLRALEALKTSPQAPQNESEIDSGPTP